LSIFLHVWILLQLFDWLFLLWKHNHNNRKNNRGIFSEIEFF